MRRYLNYTKAEGVVTAVAEGRLIDAGADFLGGGGAYRVYPGDVVERESGAYAVARVVRVVSGTELLLSSHIFTEVGQRYRVRAGFVSVRGVATARAEGRLVDEGASFLSAGVRPGFTVYAGGEWAVVRRVLSETELELSRDIVEAGEEYWVYPGEWVYAEVLEEFQRATRRLLGADSTEVVGEEKECPFFRSRSHGMDVRTVYALVEAQGPGEVYLKVDGFVATRTPVPEGWSVAKLRARVELSDDAVHRLAVGGSEGVRLRLVEFWASEVEE